ncbi:MAG TPA: serine/threonine-protein kinase [Solirubrobacterales bacterium]|nr:serine/threonine-protein kinase [Solirubrobacterales bacterium]
MVDDLVIGRFRVRERIGSGGMGVVYRAFDERLQRDVALKEVASGDPERVLREAQAAARLNHPGIVTVYELGRHRDRAVLVSELVDGPTLAELTAGGAVSDREVAELGADLCDALGHAHARGVIHRDLKPQNVIVGGDGVGGRRAMLMDFGIARLSGAPTLTATGEVVGTLAYMAPEQSDGLPAGAEADVYSLALTLYESWAGLNPVVGPTPAATARAIGRPVPSLGEYRSDLDPELVALVDSCLVADPSERPPLEALAAGLDASLPRLDPDRPLPASAGLDPGHRHGRAGARRLGVAAGLLGAIALLAGPAGAPGAALVLGALGLAGFAALPGGWAVAPLLAPALGAVGAAIAYPAAAAHAAHGVAGRAVAGALGWCWLLALALGFGIGSSHGVGERAPAGWESSAELALDHALVTLAEPAALAGMALFAVAAVALGWVLSARHLPVAALGALVWAAGLAAVAGVPAGSLAGPPLIAALAAVTAIAYERLRRAPAPRQPIPAMPGAVSSPASRSQERRRPTAAPGLGSVAHH